jgi:acetolactate synthase-1/2/3 large subunit
MAESAEMSIETFGPLPSAGPDPVLLDRVADLLILAEKPGLLLGGEVRVAHAYTSVRALAEAVSGPVFQATPYLDLFPYSHPLWAGTVGYACNPAANRAFQACDVLLCLGARLDDVSTLGYKLIQPAQRLVEVSMDPDALHLSYADTLAVISHPELFAARLVESLRRRSFTPPAARLEWAAIVRTAVEAERTVTVEGSTHHVHPAAVVEALQDCLPEDALIVSDVGNFAGWFERLFRFNRPDTFYFPTSSAMGYGLPTAIGAALARPDRPVVAVAGDGGALMTLQELETAVRLGVRLIMIVFNNNMYGTIRLRQEILYPGRPVGTLLGNPDFAALARAFGAHGRRVQNSRDLRPALADALTTNGVTVLEVLVDPDIIAVNQSLKSLQGARR